MYWPFCSSCLIIWSHSIDQWIFSTTRRCFYNVKIKHEIGIKITPDQASPHQYRAQSGSGVRSSQILKRNLLLASLYDLKMLHGNASLVVRIMPTRCWDKFITLRRSLYGRGEEHSLPECSYWLFDTPALSFSVVDFSFSLLKWTGRGSLCTQHWTNLGRQLFMIGRRISHMHRYIVEKYGD